MSLLKSSVCFCCGTIITAPQFYKGKAYGYTCITKVAPEQKRIKDNGLWVKADNSTVEVLEQNNAFVIIKATVNGVLFKERAIRREGVELGQNTSNNIKGGLIKIAEHKNGTGTIWNNTEIKQQRVKGKLKPLSFIRNYNAKPDIVLCKL